jgi:hypothetical protein
MGEQKRPFWMDYCRRCDSCECCNTCQTGYGDPEDCFKQMLGLDIDPLSIEEFTRKLRGEKQSRMRRLGGILKQIVTFTWLKITTHKSVDK